MEFIVQLVHISEVRPGDTIEHLGLVHTVGRRNIKSGFMGRTLYGDSYRLGQQPVRKLLLQHLRPCLT